MIALPPRPDPRAPVPPPLDAEARMHDPIRHDLSTLVHDGLAGILTTVVSMGLAVGSAVYRLAGGAPEQAAHRLFADAAPVVSGLTISDIIGVASVIGTAAGGWITKILLARAEIRRSAIEDKRERDQAERDERQAQREEREKEERSRIQLHVEATLARIELQHREVMAHVEEMKAKQDAVLAQSGPPAALIPPVTTGTP